MRVNLGCGDHPLNGWVNVDADVACPADVYTVLPALPFADASCEDIYAGHLLEHLTHEDGASLLAECLRVLVPGGRLGVLVPDTRAIMGTWLGQVPARVEFPLGTWRDVRDLDEVCALFLFSTVQPSHHLWAYDLDTLGRALTRAGFVVTGTIDRFNDPRVALGAWYQCGLDERKPA